MTDISARVRGTDFQIHEAFAWKGAYEINSLRWNSSVSIVIRIKWPMLQHPSPVRIRIRSRSGDLYAMGPGKAELLMAIQETGSIAAGGRQLGMSYQKTRQLVDEMNQCFVAPLVEGFKGGAQGGGARLTDLGREVLDRFLAMQLHAEQSIADELDAFRILLAP